MRVKRLAALLLSGVLATSMLAGCGVDKDAVVATLDGENVTLGVANFAARLQQAQYDDFYVAYFGETVWSSDLYGNGTTMEATVKDSTLSAMQEYYTVQNHMDDYGVSLTDDEKNAIADAAANFISDNESDAIEALGATSDIVEEYLTLVTIRTKMYDAIIADADTEVSDEEANTSDYSYVLVSKTSYTDADGNSQTYTEDELTELASTVSSFAKEAADLGLEEAAENFEYTVSTGTFASDNTTLDADVLAALQALEAEGEISDLVETDSAYYVLRLDTITNEEATETHRQQIISQRQSDLYDEVLTSWEAESEWVVNEKVWEAVSFDNLFTTTVESTETVDETEAVDTTEAE